MMCDSFITLALLWNAQQNHCHIPVRLCDEEISPMPLTLVTTDQRHVTADGAVNTAALQPAGAIAVPVCNCTLLTET